VRPATLNFFCEIDIVASLVLRTQSASVVFCPPLFLHHSPSAGIVSGETYRKKFFDHLMALSFNGRTPLFCVVIISRYKFTHRSKICIFAPQGRLHRFTWNLAQPRGT